MGGSFEDGLKSWWSTISPTQPSTSSTACSSFARRRSWSVAARGEEQPGRPLGQGGVELEQRASGEDRDRASTGTAPSGMAVAGGPLDRRIALRSLALSLRPGFEVNAAAATLATLADGNRTALLRAIARVRGGVGERSGPTADRAAAALRLALARLEGPDTAEFLVRLHEQVLDAFASLYRARADWTDGDTPIEAAGPVSNGDRPLGSAGGSG